MIGVGLLSSSGSAASDATVSPIVVGTYSDGRDGNADLDGINGVPWATLSGSTYTAIRDVYPNNLRVRSGIILKMNGFRGPYCRGKWTNEGASHDDGLAAVGQTGGVARAAGSLPATYAGGAGGAAAGNGAAGNGSYNEAPVAGRFSGCAGGAGAATTGGGAGIPTALGVTRGGTHAVGPAALGIQVSQIATSTNTPDGGSSGGGGGGGAAAVGGGGGASGGVMDFCARELANTGRISANGGDGAAGGGAGAGGGSAGGGGRVRYWCGTFSGNLPEARGGKGGLSGSATGTVGAAGLYGDVLRLNPQTVSGTATEHVSISAAEMSAAIVAGVLDIGGTFIAGTEPGIASASAAEGLISKGGGDFTAFEGTSADGRIALRYIGRVWRLEVRGATVLTCATLTTGPAAPTVQPWRIGDTIAWRIWYDPAGGARSMGIRVAVNNCYGYDTTGAGSGSALAAMTTASALGTISTSALPRTANVVGRIVVIGDSLSAPKDNSTPIDGVATGALLGAVTGPVVSLAQSGGQIVGAPSQLSVWQASNSRGNAGVLAVIIQVGWNDILSAGKSAATVLADLQTLVNDIATNNPAAKIVICQLPPIRRSSNDAQWTSALDVNIGINNGGGTPITGVHARVTSHAGLAGTMSDGNGCALYPSENNDHSHQSIYGRQLNATAMAAGVVAAGVAL